MNRTTMRSWLLATSVISGVTALALAGAANAADATAASSVMSTISGVQSVATNPASPIKKVTAASDATATNAATVSELVVTGSRIPQPNLTSVSPIQAVGHQDFQLQGYTDAIDLLNQLPQNFQNNTADFSNTTNPLTSPGGITTADLRGLGPQRTLVLVDGRRLGIGDPNTGDPNPAPDLDQIPVALIDHVEILTGGASATYGSDAIAGVVNFVMKQNFEGVQIDGTAGIDQHNQHDGFMQGMERAAGITPPTGSAWDGQNADFSVVMGTNAPDDRGNVTGYFEFKHMTPVTQGARDWSDCLFLSQPTSAIIGGPNNANCFGSTNSNQFIVSSGPNVGASLTNVGNQLLPWPQAGSSPPALFNASPYEYLSRDDTRYMGGFFAHYEIKPWAQPYAQFMFMSDRTQSEIAPSGAFEGSGPVNGGFNINCDNPLMSAQEQAALCGAQAGTANTVNVLLGRRNIEGGPRIANFVHDNYRAVIGMKGDFLDDAWHYDAYGSYYYTSLYNSNQNYLSIPNIQNALLVDPATGQCQGGIAGCVPYNIFQTGGVTPQQLAYLSVLGTSNGSTEEQIFEGNIRGDLGKYGIKSPWASDGVQIDFGTQHRWDHLVFAPDAEELSGNLSGFAGASVAVNNAITVQEEYIEAQIPIAQNLPFFHDFFLNPGARYSSYSTSGGVWTYKIGGQWSPVRDFTLRGSYDHAIRAASILEAFSPNTVTNVSLTDPCAAGPGVAATATLAQCMRTGVTAAEYGNGIGVGAGGGTNLITPCPAGQCATELGGNAALKPEIADTWSIGGVFKPHFLPGFVASIDYWDIAIAGEIGTVPQSLSLSNCLNGVDTATYCPNVVRTPTGLLFGQTIAGGGYVVATNQNIAAVHVGGIDFAGDYRLDLADVGAPDIGSLLFHFTGTFQAFNDTTTLPGQPMYNCAGLYGPTCQNVDPKWRHTFSVAWNTPWNVLARIQWRYIGSTTLDNNSPQTALYQGYLGIYDGADAKIPAINYIDLSGEWRVNTILTVRAGVNNLFDQDPPLVSQLITGIGAPNAYPTYDLLGRQMFVSATAKF